MFGLPQIYRLYDNTSLNSTHEVILLRASLGGDSIEHHHLYIFQYSPIQFYQNTVNCNENISLCRVVLVS